MSIKNLISEMVEGILTEIKQPYIVIDTADNNRVVAMASDEKGAKSSIASAERPPMSIKDKNTLKVVKSKKARRIGEYITEAVAKIACVKCDEVSTAAAWQKKGGFCPKCKVSNQGVAESVELDEVRGKGRAGAIEKAMSFKPNPNRSEGFAMLAQLEKEVKDLDKRPGSLQGAYAKEYNKLEGKMSRIRKKYGIRSGETNESVELDEAGIKTAYGTTRTNVYGGGLASDEKRIIPKRGTKAYDKWMAANNARRERTNAARSAALKNEEVDLSEDVHNDLNDLVFDFQKKIMKYGRSNLDEKIAKKLKAIDNDLDDLRSDLFKIRPGR
jgi:hypothetical protein